MLIGSTVSFGVLLLSWLVLPLKSTGVDATAVASSESASRRHLA